MPAARKTAAKPDKASWKKSKRHEVVLPSGFSVTIEVPNLALLVKTGYLPNELVQQALGAAQTGKLTAELVAEQADFYAKLVTITVKEPELVAEDVTGEDAIPYEDIEMIVELATRQRDIDAMGHHLGGLHTTKEWRQFRGIEHLYEDVEGAQGSQAALAPTV